MYLRRLACILLVAFSAQTHAEWKRLPYYSQKFYSDVEQRAGDPAIKSDLFQILSNGQIVLGYQRAREILFGELHLLSTGNGYAIKDVYCEHLAVESEFSTRPPGPGKIPDSKIVNTEHTWPQSRFSKEFDVEMQKSDLHILFPVLSRANSSRNNLKYGNITTTTSSPCPASKRGYTANGNKEQFFEVPDSQKGNAARATFYFSIRYHSSITPDEEATLREWSRVDPVDQDELRRNESIYGWEKVRNPFIDYPDLVELISDF